MSFELAETYIAQAKQQMVERKKKRIEDAKERVEQFLRYLGYTLRMNAENVTWNDEFTKVR